MGCDIHAFVEVKIDGAWHCHHQARIDRDYQLFGYMAGVRCHDAEHVPPRGFPDDASVVTRLEYEYWDGGAHTPSWLTSEELRKALLDTAANGKRVFWGLVSQFGYIFGNAAIPNPDYPEDIPPFPVRVVFWFDN